MKATIDIRDELLERARRRARETGRSLSAVIEDGLRAVLPPAAPEHRYRLPDLRVGDPDAVDPLERYSWAELRELIHPDRSKR